MENWQQSAEKLSKLVSKKHLYRSTVDFLDNHPPSAALGIACSGGADSVFLTLALWTLWPALRPALVILHYNHGLRGEEADADERYVQVLADRLDVCFRTEKCDNSMPFGSALLNRARIN